MGGVVIPSGRRNFTGKFFRGVLVRGLRVPPAVLLGTLLSVVVVHLLQVGSIEGATGAVGRTLMHSATAYAGCEERFSEGTEPSPVVVRLQSTYAAALARFASSGVPGNKQPGELTARLLGGGDNALEALGGRMPPERALQLVALTVPLRAEGPVRTISFEPSPTVPRLCR